MDTKLKKCKIIVSFIVFILGVSLLLNGVVKGVNIAQKGPWKEQLSMAFEEDYQNTKDFRWYISESLEEFLAMAVGGPVSQNWSFESGNNNYETYAYGETENLTQVEESVIEDSYGKNGVSYSASSSVESGRYDYDENGNIIYYSYGDDEYVTSSDPELNKKTAEKIHNSIKDDKNLLYRICHDNKVMYENTEGMHLDGTVNTLPEGYNFLLYFDGSTVTITKDGKELDIYGDGYYKEDSKWYVPGYKNFTIDEKTSKSTVCIAAAKSPILYMTTDYEKNDSRQNASGLYQITSFMIQLHALLIEMGISLLGAAVLLVLYSILRKKKKQGDLFLAGVTGRLWFEVKVLLLVFGVGLLLMESSYLFREMFWQFRMEGGIYFSSFLYYLRDFLSNPVPVFILFWSCYLFVNDWRYHKHPWKHSIIYSAICVFKTKELNMEFQKRMMHRYKIMILAESAVIVFSVWMLFILVDTEFIMLAVVVIMLTIQILYIKRENAVFADMAKLMEQIKAIREGNLTERMEFPKDEDLLEAVKELNDIQQGMGKALDEQMNSERMKVELVSNVSHDIKTPLTSIISYVELLEQEEDLPEHVKDYIRILSSKSERLKGMVQDVFEVSKAASGQLLVNLEELDFGKLLHQTLADMEIRIETSSVTVKSDIREEAIMIMADGQRLYRVFQNLLQNALQYSLQGSRVFVTLSVEGSTAVASVKNTSESEISDGIDVTERFTRGDTSRSDGGSGLGLSIAKSFTEACGGEFQVETIADLFVVTVKFQQL